MIIMASLLCILVSAIFAFIARDVLTESSWDSVGFAVTAFICFVFLVTGVGSLVGL